jgi:hypothetical protein
MGVELKKIYSNVAKSKETEKRRSYVKVSANGAVLGINGSKEKVEVIAKNLYAASHDIADIGKLGETDLSKYHIVLVGSHDKKIPMSDKLKKYVEDGGYLITTSASLGAFVADLFPDMVTSDKKEIKGGFYKGELESTGHPFFRGASKKKAMKFFIEDKSHPIKKTGPTVKVLASSKKLEKKFGSGIVIAAFPHGNGMFVYMLPKIHNLKSGEGPNYINAYIISNILDEAVNKAIPDVMTRGSDMSQMAYVNMAVLDKKDEKCMYCSSTFKDYDGKVFKCSSCGTYYHQFCLDQQLSADGTCKKCGKFLVYEQFKQTIVQAPWEQPPPQAAPAPEPERQKQKPPPPPLPKPD